MLNSDAQVFEQIKKAGTILVTTNRAAGGDAVASALATYLYLKKLGKKAELIIEGQDSNKNLKFLPAQAEIKNKLDNLRRFIISLDTRNTKVGQIQYKAEAESLDFIVSPLDGFFTKDDITTRSSGFKYDLIITLNTQDLESLGQIYDHDTEFFYQTTIINIDHQAANESYGQINLIDLNAICTSEILYRLFATFDKSLIDEDIATCLLAGLIIATKSFKTSLISPTALTTASELIGLGAHREEIVNSLYRSRSLNLLKLWGIVLARMTSSADNKIISSMVSNEDFQKTKTGPSDLYEVIDELIINIPQAKIILLVYESLKDEQRTTEALVYGIKNLNVYSLLEELKPSGHKFAVNLTSTKPIKEFENDLSLILNEKVRKLEI